MKIDTILKKLNCLAKNTEYNGYDPYDGLYLNNLFGNIIKRTAFGRLFLIHLNKRLIFNIRPLIGIKKDLNAKTTSLFITGFVRQRLINKAEKISAILLRTRSNKYDYYAWGYYFDWQSRVFFQPAHTPTIVSTSFVCNALLDLYETTKEGELLSVVESSISFFVNDLNIFEDSNGICFSYSPLDHSVIYNASALGLEVIARYQSLTGNKSDQLETILDKGVRFLKSEQNPDGSWYYGKQMVQHFIDHYHTAYILESLENIRRITGDAFKLEPTIEKGIEFYLNNMFNESGAPKYYKNALYPIESHCSGAAIKALCVLSEHYGVELYERALKVADWTIDNLYDEKSGYFYYQKRKFWTNKINYLRWSQSWMFVGLSYLIYYGKKYDYSFY